MAKLVKIFENGEAKTVLTFRNKDYKFTMGKYENGVRKSKEESIENQVFDDYKDDDLRDLIVSDIEDLDSDDDTVQDALDSLEDYE